MNRSASQDLADRILDCFPSGSYALAALLRLLDIVATDAVPTAAVECRAQPRLLVNPAFVARHAPTPEQLLMLVMHELHHVLLGHTTLFPTTTPVQNFVFDCVINALLSRMFPARENTAFLTGYYDDARYPECLLRPPAGWAGGEVAEPPGIAALGRRDRAEALGVYRSLYSPGGATYKELFDVLPRLVAAGDVARVPLLGGHDAEQGRLEARAPVLFDVVRGIVEEWPQPPEPIAGRSLAALVDSLHARPRRQPSARAVLRELIRRVADAGRPGRHRRLDADPVTVASPLPALDRRSLVLQSLGAAPLLHPALLAVRRPAGRDERVHVYLDVSGSVDGIKDALYGAVLDLRDRVHGQVHLFSTRVADVTLDELRRGVCRSTGGTDIGCVAEHMAERRVRRALLVTDGFTGEPRGRHRETLARARLAVGYAGGNINERDLAEVADYGRRVPLGG